jgi:CHAT domain-containing protein/tetratricopeptide (TPR) repeat protein
MNTPALAPFVLLVLSANPSAAQEKSAGGSNIVATAPADDKAAKGSEAKRLGAEGERLAKARQWAEAAATFEKAAKLLESSPESSAMLSRAGNCWFEQRQWERARAAFAAALKIAEPAYGPDHWRTGNARRGLKYIALVEGLSDRDVARLEAARDQGREAMELFGRGRTAQAFQIQREVVETFRTLLGDGHLDYAKSLYFLATFHREHRDFAQAAALYEQALDVKRKAVGEMHPDFAASLNGLAMLHFEQADYAKAEPLFRQALEVTRRSLGTADPRYAAGLNNLATLHKQKGEHAAAERLLLEALEIKRTALGESSVDYASSLLNLAGLHYLRAEYGKAEPLYKQALEITRQAAGATHPLYGQALDDLALLYFAMGDYERAEPLFRQAFAIHSQAGGEGDPAYATSLNNLAMVHHAKGEFAAAEPLFRRALELRRSGLGEAHPTYGHSLTCLAAHHYSRGDFAKAAPLYRQALDVARRALGETHPDYAINLSGLAAVAYGQGEFGPAERLYREALDATRQALGEAHPDFAACLNNLATVALAKEDYETAGRLFQEAVDAKRKALGERHPDYASSLNNLAAVRHALGDYKECERLSQKTLEVYREAQGESHPLYARSLANLGALHQALGNSPKAERLYRESLRIYLAFFEATCLSLDEPSQLALFADVRFALEGRLLLDPGREGAAPATHYADLLAWKGLVTTRQRLARSAAAAKTADPGAGPLLAELERTSRRLARLSVLKPEQAQAAPVAVELKKVADERERLEVELAGRTTALGRLHAERRLATKDLQRLLGERTVLIDLVAVHGKNARLFAFVIHPNAVHAVDLGQPVHVANAVDDYRRTLTGRGRALEGKDDPGRVLYERLWKPLTPHLKGAKHLIVSPDGVLTRLPFAALPVSEDKYLIEECQVTVLPVPRMLPDLLSPLEKQDGPPSLLAVGGVDFDAVPQGSSPSPSVEKLLASSTNPLEPRRRGALGADGRNWPALPGAAREAEAVAALFKATIPNGQAATLAGPKATADAVRKEATKSRYVHVATHGFFADPKYKSALAANDNKSGFLEASTSRPAGLHPGLLSGLVFAGANNPTVDDDGVLTALEVGDLDLSKVELAFLSACETGLGEVAGGEGVLGLQRAFQVAGAKSTVTSLWKVDDQATEMLVTRFYKNLWEKKLPKGEALREAQLWMLKEGRGAGIQRGLELKGVKRDKPAMNGRLPPHYWAAFVLSGDWR